MICFFLKQTAESECKSSKNTSRKGSLTGGERTKFIAGAFALNNYMRDRLLERLSVQNIDDDFDRAMTQERVRDLADHFTIDIRRFLMPLPVECLNAVVNEEIDSDTSSLDSKEANDAPLFFYWFFRIAESIGGSDELQLLWGQR